MKREAFLSVFIVLFALVSAACHIPQTSKKDIDLPPPSSETSFNDPGSLPVESDPIITLDLSSQDSGDLQQLAQYPFLEQLNINGRGFEDFSEIKYCKSLKYLDARGNSLTVSDYESLTTTLPECQILWDIPLLGSAYDCNTTQLDLSAHNSLNACDLLNIKYFISLEQLDLRLWQFSLDEMNMLTNNLPNTKLLFSFSIAGISADSTMTELDISGQPVSDTDEIIPYIRLMPELTFLDMCDCGLSNEQMEVVREAFPSVKVVWRLYIKKWSLRTDAIAFSTLASGHNESRLNDTDIEQLKYCTDLKALDLGHQRISDLSVIGQLSDLRVLILADNNITDLTPLSNLKELRYIELFVNEKLSDISPLSDCNNLVDVNLGHCPLIKDFSPLYNLKHLERVYINGLNLSAETKDDIISNLPADCEFVAKVSWGSVDGAWRKHDRYYALYDMFRNNYIDALFTIPLSS